APETEPEAEPPPPSEVPPAPEPATEEAAEETEAPAGAEDEKEERFDWLENFGIRMFVDSYYMKDWLFPSGDQNITGTVGHRAFAHTNGFAVSFVALDVDYQSEKFGATVNLRWGPSTPRLIIGAPDSVSLALENLKQGYLSWRPVEGLQLDLGQFDTIYGAEVSESFDNINYTRGALYFLMQPFYHTGLRASYAFNDKVSLTGLVVNATNDHIDSNPYPDVGLQLGFTPNDTFALALGYLVNLTENELTGDLDHQHFVDLVATADIGNLSLVFNADVGATVLDQETAMAGGDTKLWWGASLAAGYAVTSWFDVGLRGEFLQDVEDQFYGFADGMNLVTGTLTLGFKPIPGRDNLLIRLDNRVEWASESIFPENGTVDDPTTITETNDVWASTVLGVVVKTD
ncbi:MAG: outer membrane beta-barrel protein, partial [Myxococcota bacterium]